MRADKQRIEEMKIIEREHVLCDARVRNERAEERPRPAAGDRTYVRAAGRCAIEGRSSCGPGQPARAATAKVAQDTAAAAYPERLVWCPVSLAAGLQHYSIQKRKRWSPEEMIIVCVDVDGG
jgi:hypothetical protein